PLAPLLRRTPLGSPPWRRRRREASESECGGGPATRKPAGRRRRSPGARRRPRGVSPRLLRAPERSRSFPTGRRRPATRGGHAVPWRLTLRRSDHPLGEHRVRHLHEAADVGPEDVVARPAVALGRGGAPFV